MDANTIHILNQWTTNFYASCADSFSATRQQPWDGWERLLDELSFEDRTETLSVLDVGCGNLRFEEFLTKHANADLELWAIDNCPQLLSPKTSVRFQELDIVSTLMSRDFLPSLKAPPCEWVTSFGLFHHIPSRELRMVLLENLIAKAKPGGVIVISLWRLEKDPRLLKKAQATTAEALALHPELQLEDHDWLLGWQDSSNVFRYCHSFSDAEIDDLIQRARTQTTLIHRYGADGKNHELNEYLVFEKLSQP